MSYNRNKLGIYMTYSQLKLYDKDFQEIAYCKCECICDSSSYKWPNNTYALLRPNDYTQINGNVTITTHYNNKSYCDIGFTIATDDALEGTKVSLDAASILSFHGDLSEVNELTKKPIMPYGDMSLSYLKFEYKDVNN